MMFIIENESGSIRNIVQSSIQTAVYIASHSKNLLIADMREIESFKQMCFYRERDYRTILFLFDEKHANGTNWTVPIIV